MKVHKLFTAGLLAVAMAGVASAQTQTIKWTGSTAFRKATWFSIVSSVTSPKVAVIGTHGPGNDTTDDFSGASQGVITGTLNGNPVVIQLCFQGSVGGVGAVADQMSSIPNGPAAAVTWMAASDTTGAPAVTNTGTALKGAVWFAAGTGTFDTYTPPQVTNSDSFYTSTPYFNKTNIAETANSPLGVVQFFWVKGADTNGVASRLSNITSQQANYLLATGEVPLAYFTGNSADAGTDVVLVGRNTDSGTRLDVEAESDVSGGAFGFGQGGESLENAVISGGVITTTVVDPVGNNSGGNVATALDTAQHAGALDDSGNPFIMVGYLGLSDKNTAIGTAAPGTVLTFNGVDGTNNNNILSGTYSFWAYEHTYYLSATTGGHPAVTAAQLADINLITGGIITNVAQSGIDGSTMIATRSLEGGTISY